MPVVILLRASGWRISDVLNLRYDTCLKRSFNRDKQQHEYSLIGDIPKTQILEHDIPISAEIAALIETQSALAKQISSEAKNPKHYLFPAKTLQRQGRSLTGRSVQNALNRLAVTYNIRGEDEKIFHFGTHAFRHTKAVELINQGMSLVMVQQWMAHLSPQMTLVYAQILAETMRREWEKVEAKVGVRFLEGKPTLIASNRLQGLLTNNTFDPLRIREHRVNIKLPVGNCVKPKDFQCRFVELPCFNCPMHVLTEVDLPWLLNYELQLLERIEIGKQAGNTHWVDANQKLLEEKVRPTIALLRQRETMALEAQDVREYTTEEWEQRLLQRGNRHEQN
ncbi:MAG TPA: tyrosine-type recombinase/integrase [Ktedonobacterales bacterium]